MSGACISVEVPQSADGERTHDAWSTSLRKPASDSSNQQRSCVEYLQFFRQTLQKSAVMVTERKPRAVSQFTPYLKGSSKFILGLKNVFSEQECQELIDRSEQHVYEAALVNFDGDGYVVDKTARDSDRVMLDDPITAAEIFDRLRPWLPEQIGACKVCGVNERLRFLRYDVAQQFTPHYDGCYERPDGLELSFLTVQVYLNGGDFEGGETTFFDDEGNEQCRIRPYAGLVVLFDHDILHEGSPVRQGRKYVLRSDIMYSRCGATGGSIRE